MSVIKKFEVNDFITLKLEVRGLEFKTCIYIAGKYFRTCAYLLIVQPDKLIQGESESIDDVAENLSETLYDVRAEDLGLSPEQEFIGHCSNLQAWCDYDYDTRILHSSLAFPLLRRLKEVGDKRASEKYYEELIDRYLNGSENNRKFLQKEGFLKDIPSETRLQILECFEERHCISILEKQIGRLISFFNYSGFARAVIGQKSRRIRELYFENQKELTSLPKCLLNCSALKKLEIKKHYLKEITDLVFKIDSLKILNITWGKKIESIQIDAGKNLKELNISNNNLKYFPKGIEKLKNLEVLDIGNNSFKSLPKEIETLKNLKNLRIANNPIKELLVSLKRLNSLKCLNLANTKLKKVPKISKDSMLEVLNISNTRIVTLPSNIGVLKKLKRIISEKNTVYDSPTPLESLPESIGDLASLEHLIIKSGKLKELPENFGKLKNLKILDLSGNRLESLPNSFCELKSLEYLNLANNKISKLPQRFNNLQKLKFLSLAYNKLEQFPTKINKLNSLKELWLSNNRLKTLSSGLINLKSLKKLAINGNEIFQVPEPLGNMSWLKLITYDKSKIKFLPGSLRKFINY